MNQLTQQTMTIKELAEVAGCSVKTIRRIVKQQFPNMIVNGRETRFTKEEAFDVMALLPKQNDLGQPRTKAVKVGQGSDSRLDRIEQSLNGLIGIMGEFIKSQTPKEEPKQIAPKLEPKDEIRRIINSYTGHTGSQYRDNWNLLYQECYYRLGKNFRVLAQNRQVKPMDIIVSEGFAPDVLLIARDLFQLGRS